MGVSTPLRWHGGKSYLAQWIISHFPDRSTYTHYAEPFAGGLSVLFAHNPIDKSEAVNDLNGELSNFWRILAQTPDRLLRILSATPQSQVAFDEAIQSQDDDAVQRATAFFIRYRQSRQGLGKDYCTPTKRIRRGRNEHVSAWCSAVDGLPEAHERLRRVEVRNMDAVKFIKQYDHQGALFYCDPPYMHESRVTTKDYEHEMSVEDHRSLLKCLSSLEGKFLLSGYSTSLYDEYAAQNGWRTATREIDNKASGRKDKQTKTEVLWMNY